MKEENKKEELNWWEKILMSLLICACISFILVSLSNKIKITKIKIAVEALEYRTCWIQADIRFDNFSDKEAFYEANQ